MVPIAVIVVVAVIAALALAASAVLALKLRSGRRQSVRESYATDDDIEKFADAPTRKVQIQRGRVVSWHSAATRSMKNLARIPTPKIFSSRPSSTLSLPRTIDLENEIAQFRRDYARAKEMEAENPGSGDVNGLIPVSRLEVPHPAAVRPPQILSAITESEDPADFLKESSWETYNGHRQNNHPLSSSLSPLSPSLEKEVIIPDFDIAFEAGLQRPAPSKSKSSDIIGSLQSICSGPSAPTKPMMQRSQTDVNQSSNTFRKPPPLPLDTFNLDSIIKEQPPRTASTSDFKSPTAPSIQSAIYKSPVQELVPAAPKPRKPSKLDLRGSFSKLDYGFPSPPLSSSVFSSLTRSSMYTLSTGKATFGGEDIPPMPDRRSTFSDQLRHGDFMDLESVTTRSRASSRATTRSWRSRSRSSHRGRRRPYLMDEDVPPLPGQEGKEEAKPLDTDAYLASPTASDAASIWSKKSRRRSIRASIASTYSMMSPTFAVTPVFRVPLYNGKGANGAKLKTIPKRPTAAALVSESGELERRGSEGDVVRKPKQLVREQEKPSILRTFSHDLEAAERSSNDLPSNSLESMLRQAHDMAGCTDPITPRGLSPVPAETSEPPVEVATKPQPSRARTLAQLQIRPILKGQRTVSHHTESEVATQQSRPDQMSRSVSANLLSAIKPKVDRLSSRGDKALPPLPPPTTPPGVQRVPVQFLRVADPDSTEAADTTQSVRRSGLDRIAGSAARASRPSSKPVSKRSSAVMAAKPAVKATSMPTSKRSSAVMTSKPAATNTAKPFTEDSPIMEIKPLKIVKATSEAKKTQGAPRLPEITPMSKLAFGPTVTSCEVPNSGSERSESASSAVEIMTEHRDAERTDSPAVSAISYTPDVTNHPAKRMPVGRARLNHVWDEQSAVSPLSFEFPNSFKS